MEKNEYKHPGGAISWQKKAVQTAAQVLAMLPVHLLSAPFFESPVCLAPFPGLPIDTLYPDIRDWSYGLVHKRQAFCHGSHFTA